jgi:chitodextrinase
MQRMRNAAAVLRGFRVMKRFITAAVLVSALLTGTGRAWGQQVTVTGQQLAPLFGTAGSPLVLSAATIPGPALSYQWDFGDGQQGSGATTTHTYIFPGTYTVTLTAQSPSGIAFTGVTAATIAPAPIPRVGGVVAGSSSVASPLGFVTVNAYGPYSGAAGQPITFNGSSNASAPQFSWDFGDGQTGTGASVSHAYVSPGTYFVRLTVYDAASAITGAGGTTALVSGVGTVPAPLSPSTATGPAPVTAGAPVVRYPAGWNLIAGPAGTSFPQALGVLYTWQPGDSSYESLPATTGVQAGAGYWAYFPQPVSASLNGTSTDTAVINLSPGEVVLAGNPSATATVAIRGADLAMAYDAPSGRYRTVQTLSPGGAAWVSIGSGGTVTLSP